MTMLDQRHVVAESLSSGWIGALKCLLEAPNRKAVHVIVRILKPNVASDEVGHEAQRLINEINSRRSRGPGMYDVATTRNTIFPAGWARRFPEPAELAAYYRERYTKSGLLAFRHNERGTYFGRIVAYPRGDSSPGDQLSESVRKLRAELKTGKPKSSRYEINIYNENLDRSPMSFPCLAHLSLHLHAGKLHMQAIYRNEYLIGRGYGNFSGLAELQTYIAASVGVDVGELLLTIGHVELDAPVGLVRGMLAGLES